LEPTFPSNCRHESLAMLQHQRSPARMRGKRCSTPRHLIRMQKAQVDEYNWNAKRCGLPGPCEAVAELVMRVRLIDQPGEILFSAVLASLIAEPIWSRFFSLSPRLLPSDFNSASCALASTRMSPSTPSIVQLLTISQLGVLAPRRFTSHQGCKLVANLGRKKLLAFPELRLRRIKQALG
jgi:hypothetical protein